MGFGLSTCIKRLINKLGLYVSALRSGEVTRSTEDGSGIP